MNYSAETIIELHKLLEERNQELQTSEARFRNIINRNADGIIVVDKNGIVQFINPAAENLFDRSAEELRGELFGFPLVTGETTELDIFRKGGETAVAEMRTVVTEWEGEFAYLAMLRNITERKLAEQQLRLFEASIAHLHETVVITQATPLDELGPRIAFVNTAFEHMTGYSREEVIGKSPRFLQGPKTDLLALERIRQAQLAWQPIHEELINYTKEGKEYWVELDISPINDERGSATYFVAIERDITERKQAEEAIKKLAAFPRFNPNPVLELERDGTLTFYNAAALQVAHALGKQQPAAILPPEVTHLIEECLSTGDSRLGLEITIGNRTLSWSFFPIMSSQVVHAYAFDITERLNLEAQFRQSQKMESVGQLAGGVAHDFNNILTTIQGYTDLILLSDNLDTELVEQLTQISVAAERAANLTHQLLAFSRRQVMQPKQLDLNEVISNVTKMLRRILGENITLQFNYQPSLPRVRADEGMVGQIIMNLAVNARDAMARGGQLVISTSLMEIEDNYIQSHLEALPGQYICLSVSDTGCGMDTETQLRIFEPFFTTKEVGKGTGLGLSTVYGIVKQHQGWVEVNSQVDVGSTFKVFLPSYTKPSSVQARESNRAEVIGGNETILVVEDESSVRALVRNILQRYGYRVLEAASGREALLAWEIHKNQIDLLLTDLVMPGDVGGLDLVEQLHQQQPDLKVIYTSGYSAEIVGEKIAFYEGLNLLSKPYTPTMLAQAVRACLDR
ncbi:MAG: PAS domain S-box protein [Chloroflexota bacterium]